MCVDVCAHVQATRSERNVLRDSQGHVHLGRSKSVKKLFSKNGNGAERYAKSEKVYYRALIKLIDSLTHSLSPHT